MIYYREGIQIKISQRKRCIEQSSGEFQTSVSTVCLPMESGSVILLVIMYDHMHGVLPVTETCTNLAFNFY